MAAGSDPSKPFQLITFVHDGRVRVDQLTNLKDEGLYAELLGLRYTETTITQISD